MFLKWLSKLKNNIQAILRNLIYNELIISFFKKSNVLFWKYLDCCIFGESRNPKTCDVNIGITAR